MYLKEWKKREISIHQCVTARDWEKQNKYIQSRCTIFDDYNKNINTLFSVKGIYPLECYDVYFRIDELLVFLFESGKIHQYECASFYRIYSYFYDGFGLGTDLSDEV